jgi:hypothetical protein
MLGMRGLLAVAGQGGLSAGTLLIAAGGLALYQMTSMVLGPAGSRELHLSLAIPAVDADEVSEAATPSGSHSLGTVVAITPAPSPTALRPALLRPAQPRSTAVPVPAPVVATPSALPVPSVSPAKHGHGHPQPPRQHDAD